VPKRQRINSKEWQQAAQWASPLRFGLASPSLSEHARVVTQAEPPYSVLWASPEWLLLCNFSAVEILGCTLKCIQGPQTSREALGALMAAVRNGECVRNIALVNYDAHGRAFQHVVDVETVKSRRGAVAAFVASSRQVQLQDRSLVRREPLDALCAVASNCVGGVGDGFDGEVLLDEPAAPPEQDVDVWDEQVESLLCSWERVSLRCTSDATRQNRLPPPRGGAAWG